MHLFLISLLACGTADEPSDKTDETGDETTAPGDDGDYGYELPGEYEYDDADDGTEQVDLSGVEAALDDFFNNVLSISPEPALVGYESVLDDGDSACPSWYEQDGNVFWYASCDASSGASYDGYGFYNVYEDDTSVFGDGHAWDMVYVSGAATMKDASGNTFHLGGDIYLGTGHASTSDAWVSAVYGSLAWDGDSARGTWLEDGVTPSFLAYGVTLDNGLGGKGQYVSIQGTIGNLSSAATALEFEYLLIVEDGLYNYPCGEEPAGAIGVRDADGVWYDVVFDVNPETFQLENGGQCDGCGAVFKGTELVGEVCTDASPMLNWQEKPW